MLHFWIPHFLTNHKVHNQNYCIASRHLRTFHLSCWLLRVFLVPFKDRIRNERPPVNCSSHFPCMLVKDLWIVSSNIDWHPMTTGIFVKLAPSYRGRHFQGLWTFSSTMMLEQCRSHIGVPFKSKSLMLMWQLELWKKCGSIRID